MDAGNDEAHRSARIDLRFEGEHQVNVAAAVLRIVIDRLAIERMSGSAPTDRSHDREGALIAQRPVVVRVFVAIAGLLSRAPAVSPFALSTAVTVHTAERRRF